MPVESWELIARGFSDESVAAALGMSRQWVQQTRTGKKKNAKVARFCELLAAYSIEECRANPETVISEAKDQLRAEGLLP